MPYSYKSVEKIVYIIALIIYDIHSGPEK